MLPQHRDKLVCDLPGDLAYPYFRGREAAWVLHQRVSGAQRIAALRQGPLSPLIDRPGVRETVRACGDGRLAPGRLLPLADPLRLFEREQWLVADSAAEAAFAALCAADIVPFTVTFDSWYGGDSTEDWHWSQTSRRGANLVVQVNFPDAYTEAFYSGFGPQERAMLEYWHHPVRRDGPITMAWARLDMDPGGEDVLIEEIQTDWLRTLPRAQKALEARRVKSDRSWIIDFVAGTKARYGRIWAEATLLAAIAVARNLLGGRRVWIHQPHTGAKLKRITDRQPPRSIYTDLPRRFCFQPTDRAPDLLYRSRSQAVRRLRRKRQPVFWELDLEAPAI